jgi:protoheme IX farnesyltransferase
MSIPVYTFAIRSYALLTKPGIMMGNAITVAGGFFLASRGNIDWALFFFVVVGLCLLIASSCVFNNIIDRESDAKMQRTSKRGLATGEISVRPAFFFASILGGFGIFCLAFFTNLTTLFVALFGFFVYVILYTFSKYHSMHGTLIGSVAGAVPPVVGYCAVSQSLDIGALILFAILTIWQMPHFFAIAIFRGSDYAEASIPVLPLVKGIHHTKVQMLLYVIVLSLVSPLLTFFGYVGLIYLSASIILSVGWVYLSIQGFRRGVDDLRWARKMFTFSLLTITVLSFVMAVDYR